MRKKTFAKWLMAMSSLLLFCSPSHADLLGITPGVPNTLFDNTGLNGTTAYDPASQTMSLNAVPLATLFTVGTARLPILSPRSLNLSLRIDSSGNLLGGVPGDDLQLSGQVGSYSGVLLTGEITGFGFQNSATTTDIFDFRFRVTGGALAALYLGQDIGVFTALENSTFNGVFNAAFNGRAKGNIGSTPIVTACTGRIGDFIFQDLNRNGIQDAGEPGLTGVKVDLRNSAGAVVASTLSGPNGAYAFSGLCAGSYSVAVDAATLPPGFAPAPSLQGGDTTADSNGSPASVVLPDNTTNNPTIDFGFVSPATGSIGDFVWMDSNRNGIQDAGEPGINGVTVRLQNSAGTVIAMTVTGPNGYYQFTGLTAGNYSVVVDATTLPPGFVASPGNQGGDTTIDSNGSAAAVTLATDTSSDQTIDFGYNSPCSGQIGDFVFNDANRNGIQDAGETGINGVTVNLRNTFGTLIATTTTSVGPFGQQGYYQFSGLCAATYIVMVDKTTLPPGFVASASNQGGNPALDSDGSPAMVTLATDTTINATVDFGFNTPATGRIGDFIFNDTNRNGIQDAGEPGISGVTVILKDSLGQIIGTTVSSVGPFGNEGYYQFTGLTAGTYTVVVDGTTLPAGFAPSAANQGGNPALDSNTNPATVVLATDTSNDQTIDFGYNTPCSGSIGDFIFNDLNRNGIQDAGEQGLDGVSVILKDVNGVVIGTTTTGLGPLGQHGYYQFTGLCADSYTVSVDTTTLPAGFVASPSAQGGNPLLDSNGSPAAVTLPDDSTANSTIDFGFNSPATGRIGDFIFNDQNRNGIQDAGEPGLNGVTVTLKNSLGQVVAMQVTGIGPFGQQGYYQFTGLTAGTYTVTVDVSTLPPGFVASATNVGANRAIDSNGNPATVVLATDTSADQTIDFGYNTPATGRLGDFIFNDLNRNGLQDADEPGINGVSVSLKDSTGTIIAVTTTATGPLGQLGYYEFTGLKAGDYTVTVDETTLPPGFIASPSKQGANTAIDSNGSPAAVTLATDTSNDPTIDFGYNTPCSGRIGDFIFNDLNRNGIQDSGEPGIAGVVVNLKDGAGNIIATTTTNANGGYQFNGLCAGSYSVMVDTTTVPAGFVASATGQGGNPALDSNTNPSNVVLSTDTSTDSTVDFAFNSPCTGTIGDFIFNDLNRNGIQDAGEAGIDGISVSLKNAAGMVIATATTRIGPNGQHGYYQFTGLCLGNYSVVVDQTTLPPAFVASPSNQGGNSALDSNGSPASVSLATDTSTNATIDFGYNSPCTGVIGDFIFNDANRNGIQDSGEAGIGGVIVNLKDSLNTLIATTTTDANGFYRFMGLCAGTYRLEVVAPAGLTPTLSNQGGDRTKDSNGSPAIVTLPADTTVDNSVDVGYSSPCVGLIGDFIFNDLNRNGIQDPGESGIGGVTVNLKNAAGAIIATVISDANGAYQFSGLCAGSYTLVVDQTTLPAGFVASPRNQGGDAGLDSNDSPTVVTLASDVAVDNTADFGYNLPCTGSIGDFIFNDINRNGIQEAGEAGIAGVKVNLLNSANVVIASVTTGANGLYQFSGLCADDYTVVVDVTTLPTGYVASPDNQGGNPALDSDGSPETVSLADDNTIQTGIDFGYNAPCTGRIGDFIFNDTNRNGIQDSGETGIAGVVVILTNGAGDTIGSATTDASGAYQFTGLCAGDYTLTVDASTLPAGYVASPSNLGGNPALDSNGSPASVTLPTDSTNNTGVDFGFNAVCTGAIGDYIFNDVNRNGVQDAGETGIAGVIVSLKNAAGVVIATTTTDANGAYQFSGLCLGSYTVTVDAGTLPAGYVASPSNQGGNPALDSNGSPASVSLPSDSSTDSSVDFGYGAQCTGRIGDFIFNDTNRNGIQDAGETGIAGVAVSLKNSAGVTVATVVTDASGAYQFTGLCAGDYTLTVDASTLPAGYVASPSNQGGNPALDSNGSPASVTLPTDSTNNTGVDFGFNAVCTGSIGDYIFNDVNRNGVQDAGETGIAGVIVSLKNAAGVVIATTTTDANGAYQFSGLCLGSYTVTVDASTLPAGYVASPSNQGGNPALDSNGSPASVSLPSDSSTDSSVDFGYGAQCTGRIGDFIFNDTNRNGIQDAGETGIAGVAVSLKNSAGVTVATVVTDASGAYQFTGLCAGDYTLTVDASTLPAGYVASPSNQGGNPATDSNGSPASVTLPTDSTNNTGVDFGFNAVCTGSIGDFVFNDTNHNGIQNAGEAGIGGVIVNLKNAAGVVVATTTTAADGSYSFGGLCAGSYSVVVDQTTLPAGYTATPSNQGGNDALDSDGSPVSVTLATDSSKDSSIDFGYATPCTGVIGSVVFVDLDRDGIQDSGEPGIANVKINLKNAAGVVIATTYTDFNGLYQFTGVCLGNYTVVVDTTTLPAGFVASPSNQGSDRSVDSNGSPAAVSLATDSSSDTTIDFGYNSPCSGRIGNIVFNDLNRNGIQDSGEPGIAGVKLTLKNSSGAVVATLISQSDGHYKFYGLCAGTYTVIVDTSTLPAGYVASPSNQGSNDALDSDGSPATVTLSTDTSYTLDTDFGYNSPCSGKIGDFVFNDLNNNGIQDSGEAGIGGVKVSLKNAAGAVIATTTTASNGSYLFSTLCAATYTVVVDNTTLPSGFVPVASNQGADRGKDSNSNPATVTLSTDSSSDLSIDFGYYCPPCAGKIGDFIFNDLNANGIQDAGEAGIGGVKVSLKNSSGTIVSTQTTSSTGFYQFTGLCLGNYTVIVDTTTLPANFVASPSNQGGNPALDSNGSPATVNLASNTSVNSTIDFGYYCPPCTGKIGDFIFNDLNNNGIQDAGEAGIAGVKVSLKNSSGAVIATTTTNSSGAYQFTALCAGTYSVVVDSSTLAAGFVASPANQGADRAKDSSTSGVSVTLANGNSVDLTVDFGYYCPPCTGKIGDFIFNDLNRNGIQDAGEPGFNGVKVTLKNSSGTVIATQTTNSSGFYQFTGLCLGNYTVTVDTTTIPAGYLASPSNQGGNPALDSNGSPATVNLASNTSVNSTIDFGYYCPPCTGKIGNFIFNDLNNNGIQDSGEPGIAYVKVSLKNSSGAVIATAVTDHYGAYQFTTLCAGTYSVVIDSSTLATGFVASPANQGADRAKDSSNSGVTVVLTNSSSVDLTVDFGYYCPPCTGKIGNFIFNDLNNNGIQDSGEAGIKGVRVSLKNSSGTVIGTTTTDQYGNYQFSSLCLGNYTVVVDVTTLPSGFIPSPLNQGADRGKDGNANPATVNLSTNSSSDQTVDFGYYCPPCTGKIGNFIFNDLNGNGVQDSGEPGIAYVKVSLKNSSGAVIATAVTDHYGAYQFTTLCAGTYTVIVDITTLPANYIASPSLKGSDRAWDSNGSPATVTLSTNSSVDNTIDFGFCKSVACTGKIGNFIFNDLNKNGVQESGESGIAYVKVSLRNSAGTVIATTTTDHYGAYLFTTQCAGTYTVVVDTTTLPASFVASPSFKGSDRAWDSNGSPATVTLSTNSTCDYTIDFGFYKSVAPGTRTEGYWKIHPEAWPVESITIGGKTYSKSWAISLLGASTNGDVTYIIFKKLVAAKLNLLAGNQASCVTEAISQADWWLSKYGPAGNKVSSSSSSWTQSGQYLASRLDAYNNGKMCAPRCS